MSDGDIDRFYAIARSQRHGNDLAAIDHLRRCSTRFLQCSMRTTQQGFCAADCGNLKEETQMRCQAEATRMGHSLPIDNQQVRGYVQFPARRENQRRLAEGEKPRHVRPLEFALGRSNLHKLKFRVREHNNGCPTSPTDTVH